MAWSGGITETMYDNAASGWNRRKKGKLIFNDMLKITTTRQVSGSSSATVTTVGFPCTGPNLQRIVTCSDAFFTFTLAPSAPPPHGVGIAAQDMSDLVEEVWADCLAKRGEGNANLLETLAELDKSYALLTEPFKNLSNLVKALRRNGKRAKGYEKVAANTKDLIVFASSEWLKFRYGVTPIMNDITAIMKALETGYTSKPMVFTARSSAEITGGGDVPSNVVAGTQFRIDYTASTTHLFKVRAFYVDIYVRSIWTDLGFSTRNLFGLAWELTRYSFVKDWFGNIGSLIYANSPKVFHSSEGGQVSTREELTTIYSPTALVALTPATWTVTGAASDVILQRTVTKSRQNKVPIASYVIRHDFKFNRFIRASDAASVAIQWLNSIGFRRH
jgi:hypothetical protein